MGGFFFLFVRCIILYAPCVLPRILSFTPHAGASERFLRVLCVLLISYHIPFIQKSAFTHRLKADFLRSLYTEMLSVAGTPGIKATD